MPLLVMTKVMVADFFLIDRAGPPFQLPTELMFVYVHTLLYFLILTARWGLKFIYKIYIRYFLKIYLDNRESLDILVVSSETLKILALYFNPSFARYWISNCVDPTDEITRTTLIFYGGSMRFLNFHSYWFLCLD